MASNIYRLKDAREFPQFHIAIVSKITSNCTEEMNDFKDCGTKINCFKRLKIGLKVSYLCYLSLITRQFDNFYAIAVCLSARRYIDHDAYLRYSSKHIQKPRYQKYQEYR